MNPNYCQSMSQRPSSAPPEAMDIPVPTQLLLQLLEKQTGRKFTLADLSQATIQAEGDRTTIRGVLCKPVADRPNPEAAFAAIDRRNADPANGDASSFKIAVADSDQREDPEQSGVHSSIPAETQELGDETPAEMGMLRRINLRRRGFLVKVNRLYQQLFGSRQITDEGLGELLNHIEAQKALGSKVENIGESTRLGLVEYVVGVNDYRYQQEYSQRKRAERRSGKDRREAESDRRMSDRRGAEENSELAG